MGRGTQQAPSDQFSAVFGNRRGATRDEEPTPSVKLTRGFQDLLGDWEGIDDEGDCLMFLFPRVFEDEVELSRAYAILEGEFPGLTLTKNRPRQDAIFVSGALVEKSGRGRTGFHAISWRLEDAFGFESSSVKPVGPAMLRD